MDRLNEDNRKRLIKIINSIKKSTKIESWVCLGICAVGGLLAVGFSEKEDLLLVESSSGKGLFDCCTGKKLAREYVQNYENPYANKLCCRGIDVLNYEMVTMAGIYGGGLLTSTTKGDRVEIVAPHWPIHDIIFCPNFASIYIDKTKDQCQIVASVYEIRACGFSYNENYFVYATSSEFVLYKRITN